MKESAPLTGGDYYVSSGGNPPVLCGCFALASSFQCPVRYMHRRSGRQTRICLVKIFFLSVGKKTTRVSRFGRRMRPTWCNTGHLTVLVSTGRASCSRAPRPESFSQARTTTISRGTCARPGLSSISEGGGNSRTGRFSFLLSTRVRCLSAPSDEISCFSYPS